MEKIHLGTILKCCSISLFLVPASCDSVLVKEARNAEREGRIISNDIMRKVHPGSFRSGYPEYLERDFEAGADFICDEIQIQYSLDICSEPEIKWR